MNTAILFNKAGVFPGFEDVVSAHIQLPVYTSKLLSEKCVQNILIATEITSDQVQPNVLKELDPETIVFVEDPNKQRGHCAAAEGSVKGVYFTKYIKYVASIRRIIRENNIDVLHVFGTKKLALSAILCSFGSRRLKVVWTTENTYVNSNRLINILFNRYIDTICTTTKFVESSLIFHKNVRLLKSGVVRQIDTKKNETKKRVLFWRDPTEVNGADIALTTFKALADKYKNIIFTFAVRPQWDSLISDDDIKPYKNMELYLFPYKSSVTLEGLLSETICVVFPFRSLSTNPQLAVIETINAKIPVICSNVESNLEILNDVGLNYGLKENADDYILVLDKILSDFQENKTLPPLNMYRFKDTYSWSKYINGCLEVYENP